MTSHPSTASTPPLPLSLLSLSDAAASAHHIPVPSPVPIPIKQRHRSSFSQSRKRRPSDARDPLLTHSGALLLNRDDDRDSAASKALSLSPPGVSTGGALSKSVPLDNDNAPRPGKKGTVFRCESCSKVYRHPSCLVKHRWEHSPHWREASKFLLSKHQQVQLLEAAAILSHLSPTEHGGGTSLPEDRSLWPSYLSGGLLPRPRGPDADMPAIDMPDVPALTTFRPGLLGHPNPNPSPPNPHPNGASMPMAVPAPRWAWRGGSVESGSAGSWGDAVGGASWKDGGGAGSWTHTPYTSTSGPFSVSSERVSSERGLSVSSEREERGWSLPRSSVRGGSGDSDEEVEGPEGEDAVKEEKVDKEEEWDGMEMEMDL